ncbi:MAG: GGDEF domain-containing protein [Cyanobacteria bacterium P01_A01_bin.68]
MCIEEALELIETTLYTNTGKNLTVIEKEILIAALQKEAYATIAKNSHLSVGHIKDVAYKLWRQLSTMLGEKVTKTNLLLVLERYTLSAGITPSIQNNSEIDSNEDTNLKNYILQLQQEIQELKQTQEIIYQSRAFIESILNHSLDGIAEFQAIRGNNTEKVVDFKLLVANNVMTKFFNYSHGDLSSHGDFIGNLLLKDQIVKENLSLFNFLTKVFETKETLYQELHMETKDIQNWYQVIGTSFSNEVFLTIRNITQQQLLQAELALQININNLSHINNRHYFDEYLAREWQHSKGKKQNISLILCSINNFECYENSEHNRKNYQYLIAVALVIKNCTKNTNCYVGHYRENQFAIILSNTDIDRVFNLAHLIQSESGNLDMPQVSQSSDYLTLSVGIANMIPPNDSKAEELIIAAETMLSGLFIGE